MSSGDGLGWDVLMTRAQSICSSAEVMGVCATDMENCPLTGLPFALL